VRGIYYLVISYIEKDAGNNTITTIGSPGTDMYSKLDQLLGYRFTYKGHTSSPLSFIFDYTKSGLVNSITGDGKKFSFNYDEADNPISRANPNNTQDNFIYDEAGRITGSYTVDNSSNVKWSGKYQYDSDGRLIQAAGSGPGSPNAAYTYNNGTEKLNRLTKAVIDDGTNNYAFNYAYDPAGNIKEMDVANGTSAPNHMTFNYDADNRITNSGFSYDENGNLTQAVIDGNTYKYGYDAADRLINVKDESDSMIASYTYDGNGNRLTKTVNGVVTTYHYFDGQLLYETLSTDPENTIHALYIRSPQGALEAVSFNYVIGSGDNAYYYYHYNAHGDVIAVTDQSGNVYRQYVYDPYGNIISVKDGSGNAVDINSDSGFEHNYTYKGYRYDKETGLYFLNERYYAAGIGRFLTKDPVIDLANTQSLNRYAYALGDPVNLKDDGGLYAMPADYSKVDPNVQSYSVQRQNNFSKGAASTRKIAPSGGNAYLTKTDIVVSVLSSIASAVEGHIAGRLIAEKIFKEIIVPYGKGGIFQITAVLDKYPGLKEFYGYTGGIVSIGCTAYGIYDNYTNYEHPAERTEIDMAVFGVSIALEAFAGMVAAPALPIILGTAIISVGGTYIKNKYYGHKKH
jgi:RHS repeat-associated protein